MVQEKGQFSTFDNDQLHWEAWVPDEVKVVNIYIHGAFSYSIECQFLANGLLDLGIATYTFDQRGWGRWSKKEGFINNYEEYMNDIETFVVMVKEKHPDLPLILTGHSMGGLNSLNFLLDHQDKFHCAVISSPWIETKANPSKILEVMAYLFNIIWPKFTDSATFEVEDLTHDNELIEKYYEEIETGLRKRKATVRWFMEIKKAQKQIKKRASELTLPILITQAGQDLLVKEEAAQMIYETISSPQKKWEYFPNFYHETFNEVDRDVAIDKVKDFVSVHFKK